MIIEQGNKQTVVKRRDFYGLAQRLANEIKLADEIHEKGPALFVIKTSKHGYNYKINLKACRNFSDIFCILRSMTSKQRY